MLERIFLWLAHGRYRSAPTPVDEGGVVEFLTDALGRLRVIAEGIKPAGRYHVTSGGSGTIKATSGELLEAYGFSDDDSQVVYVLLFDQVAAPANGDQPMEVIRVPPGQSFSLSPGYPIPFVHKLHWAASAQADQLAGGAGDVTLTATFR